MADITDEPKRKGMNGPFERFGVIEFSLAFFIFTSLAFNEGEPISVVSKLLLGLVFVFSFLSGKKITINPFFGAAAGFLAISAASLIWTDTPPASSARVVSFAYQFISYFILANMIMWKRERLEFCFSWFIISALASGTYVILVQGATFQDERYVEGVISSGQLGLSCAFAIALSVYRYVNTRKGIYLAVIAPLAVFLVLTSSRRAFLVVSLFAFLFFFFSSKDFAKKTGALLAGAALLGGLYALVLNNAFLYMYVGRRIESFVGFAVSGGAGDSSTQGRQWLIEYGYSLFQSSPYFGHGIDSFSTFFSTQHGSWHTSADNNYLQLLADLGLLGFFAYYVPLLIFLFHGIRGLSGKRLLTRFALSCVVAMCLIDFASVWVFSEVGLLMLFLCYQVVYLDRPTALPSQSMQFPLSTTHSAIREWSGIK